MRWNLYALWLLTVILGLLIAMPVFAGEISVSKELAYEDAKSCLELGDHMAAIEMFSKLGTYEDSKDYVIYAWALLYLEREEFADALPRFDILAKSNLLDCEQYVAYTRGRKAEAEGDIQSAIDIYTGLGFLDSNERLLILTLDIMPRLEPTPMPVLYATLGKGSKGDEVKRLQQRLNDLGYPVGGADGNYGNNTTAAVEWFQAACGLPATGIADNETQIRLFAQDAPARADAVIPYTVLSLKDEKVTVSKGSSKQIALIVEPSYATYTLTWASQDDSIVTVDQDGKLRGVTAGTTTVTARDESGLVLTCTVMVNAPASSSGGDGGGGKKSRGGTARF